MLRPPPRSTHFPYTTLFRSLRHGRAHQEHERGRVAVASHADIGEEIVTRHADDEALAVRLPHGVGSRAQPRERIDRKSTRLNSSHSQISYAVFCLKKKKHSI